MSSLIKQVLILLWNFSSSLATKFLSLNDRQCMVKPALIDLTLIWVGFLGARFEVVGGGGGGGKITPCLKPC